MRASTTVGENQPYQSGGISGEVYNDLNGSGSLAPGDPGLDNWEVDLFDSNDNFVASQLTAGSGNFDFAGLEPGTYTISEVQEIGWTQTPPAAPYTYTVTVTAGASASGYDFGNFQNITISGESFNDLNGNGTLDPGEPGLPGWTVDLLDRQWRPHRDDHDRCQWRLQLRRHRPGHLHRSGRGAAGLDPDRSGVPGHLHRVGDKRSKLHGLVFGNYQLVTYSGTVYNDLNGSGVIAPGDPGLQGWTVDLLDERQHPRDNHQRLRWQLFVRQPGSGVYTIEEIHQTGWYQTEPQHPFVYTVTATSGASQSGLDFGNFQLVNVTGEVTTTSTATATSIRASPACRAGRSTSKISHGNTVATTTSDANGNYEFDNLFPGTFIVEEVLQSGWTQTQPVNPNYYEFTTQSGMNETGLNFGNFSTGTFTGTVYNDLNGDGTRSRTSRPWPAGRSICSIRRAPWWPRPPATPRANTRSPM